MFDYIMNNAWLSAYIGFFGVQILFSPVVILLVYRLMED